MTDEAIQEELIGRILAGSNVQPKLYIHRERPKNPFYGWTYFLSSDNTIAFLASRLPQFEAAYDVYIFEP